MITDDKIIKNTICKYASAFNNPIVIGYVVSTTAANLLGIINLLQSYPIWKSLC